MKRKLSSKLIAASGASLLLLPAAHGQCERSISAQDSWGWNDQFGHDVDLSGDVAVVGAPWVADAGIASGAAWVFQWDGAVWELTQKLRPADNAEGDSCGEVVGIDGETIVVSSYRDDDAGENSGSVYVFDWDGTEWVEGAKLTASDGAEDDWFGCSVDIAGDTIAVGAKHEENWTGAVYIFARQGATWIEEAKLVAEEPTGSDLFGQSVELSDDEQRVLIGSPYADHGGFNQPGAAYVFERDGAEWQQIFKLTASAAHHAAFFGYSVAMAGDWIVAGAPDWNGHSGDGSGAVYAFEWDGTSWSEVQKLVTPHGEPGDQFGRSVALLGARLAVGANGDDDIAFQAGATYLFELGDSGWLQRSKLVVDSPQSISHSHYGDCMALGSHLMVGAYGHGTGDVYVYEAECVFGFETYGYCNQDAPCDNADSTAGCANSTGLGGRLRAAPTCTNGVANDDLVLTVDQIPPNQFALVYMGASTERTPFGDGLRLVHPGPPDFRYHRFPVHPTGPDGSISEGPAMVAYSHQNFTPDGAVQVGSTWNFQGFYRDPYGPCGSAFNLTNAITVEFVP